MTYEQTIMQIIVNGGDARTSVLKAIRCARKGNLEEAEQLKNRANESLERAHEIQTKLIQAETRGEKSEMTLLMIHAQDHLMNAMTIKDLSEEMIEEIKLRLALETKIKGGD